MGNTILLIVNIVFLIVNINNLANSHSLGFSIFIVFPMMVQILLIVVLLDDLGVIDV